MSKGLLYPVYFAVGFCFLPASFALLMAACKVLDAVEWLIARVRARVDGAR